MMIEKRLVQWYAADAGVDLDIAEREIVLTYVLCILSEQGLLERLAFKGGTALRKIHLGAPGRFSLDLDFTATGGDSPDGLALDLAATLHGQTYHGLTFTTPDSEYYATADSCGVEVTYSHDWVTAGRFGLQISFRARPLLPVRPMPLRRERYFDWLGVVPPRVPSLDLQELIGEKVRTAVQRSRVRDLYDLYQLASQPYDRSLVRRIAVIKCWETRYAFESAAFLSSLAQGKYDWSDLARLVRPDRLVAPAELVGGVQRGYQFLADLTPEEGQLAVDPHGREVRLYQELLGTVAAWSTRPGSDG
ncbi:MAG TPA: nucleotidyl transferase AbiEii/AbiGii toxin family protein [Anaerolineae bacterium]|nr:nucleotidyl transferase AbiEii/AbiGii toxin family protein [Anaerolineae bacterium]